MPVSAAEVKSLRERTGAPMMDVKNALEEAEGDEQKAIEILRKKGAASAAKRGGRSTGEGVVAAYIHSEPASARRDRVLVEVQCETDFVARNEDFKEFARRGRYPHHGDEPAARLDRGHPRGGSRQRAPDPRGEAAKADGKPDDVVAKIVEGQLKKWASEIVLLDQKHFNEERYEGKTIEDLRTEIAAKTGENVRIARFARFEVGQE